MRVFLATEDIASLNEFSESDRSEPTPSDDELIDDEAREDRGVEELPIWVVKRRWSIFAGDITNTVICSEPKIRYERMVKYTCRKRDRRLSQVRFFITKITKKQIYKNQMMSGYKEPVIPFINGKNLMGNFNEYLSSYKLHKRSIPLSMEVRFGMVC